MKKITTAFAYSLAIISILGFVSIILNSWFEFDFITKYTAGLILIVLGIGLIFESQIRRWKYIRRTGITNDELAHIVTGIVGILSLVIGFLDIIGFSSIKFESIKGLISLIAIVVITIETWLVK